MSSDGLHYLRERPPEAVVTRGRDNNRVVPVKTSDATVLALRGVADTTTVAEAHLYGVEHCSGYCSLAPYEVVHLVASGNVLGVQRSHVRISS